MNALFQTVFHLNVVSSYIILIVLVIRFLLRKSPKLFSYALWGIVFFRLVFPVSIESNMSLIPRQINTVSIESTVLNNSSYRGEAPVTEATYNNPVVKADPQNSDPGKPPVTLYNLFPYIWTAGFGLLILINIIQFLKLQKRLTGAAHVKNNLFQSEFILTPFVMGIIKPKIYIPAGLTDYERTYIVRHEQVHIRRKDYLIKIIACFITCIHWFNPLVWLSFILMTRDMEMSCDETVIKELGGNIKKEYSASLLSLAAGRRMPEGMPLAFGGNSVKNRIKNVLNYKKPGIWAIVISVLVVVFVCTGLFFSPVRAVSDSFKSRKQPVALTNYEISRNTVRLYDGTEGILKLVMTEGSFYDEDYAGFGGGIYPENYEGSYELQLFDNKGNILSTLDLNKDWNMSKINFKGKFDILFSDYNSDNCPDFTIGTYGSSNMDLYSLYTATPENRLLCILKAPVSNSSKESSILFNKDTDSSKNRFITKEYDNSIGEYGYHIYEWDQASGFFLKANEPSSFQTDEPDTGNVQAAAISFEADLTHDGSMETIIVDTSRVAEEQTAVVSVVNESGEILWNNEAATAHAGWNSLYLTTMDGKDYILRYQPSMFQGTAAYEYNLFYLDNAGSELSYDSDRMEFSINPGKIDFEPEDLVSFADKVNGYFKNSYLLLSTENGEVIYSTPQNKITGAENYSWLDGGGVTYESQELLDKLIKFKEKYSQ